MRQVKLRPKHPSPNSSIILRYRYIRSGRGSYAIASLVCIFSSLFLQSLLVYLGNRNLKPRRQIKEQLIVWTLIKPGVDAYRCARDREREAGHIFPLKFELSCQRILEIVFEALPGTLVQTAAMLDSGDHSFTAITSLSTSILATAFISAQLSHEWDIGSEQRKKDPNFYGYLPKGMLRRTFCCFLIFLISAFNLVIRALAFVTLLQKGGGSISIIAVFGGETSLFYVSKAIRKGESARISSNKLAGSCCTNSPSVGVAFVGVAFLLQTCGIGHQSTEP